MVNAIIISACATGSLLLIAYQIYKKIRYDWVNFNLSLEERKHYTAKERLEIERLQKEMVFSPIQSPHGHMVVFDHNSGRYIEFEKSVAFGHGQNEQAIDGESNYRDLPPLLPAIQNSLSLVLLGAQGTGKTTLLCHLLDQRSSQGENCIVIDPHGYSGKYPTGKMVGEKRDYMAIDRELQGAIDEMDMRYAEYPAKYEPTTYFVDEYTLLHRHCNNTKEFIERALTEFRKVNLRLVLCLHSRRAKFLNLQGAMDLAEGIDFCALHNDQGNRYAELERSGSDTREFYSLPGNYHFNNYNTRNDHKNCHSQTTKEQPQPRQPNNNGLLCEEHKDYGITALYRLGYSISAIAQKIFGGKNARRNNNIKSTLHKYHM